MADNIKDLIEFRNIQINGCDDNRWMWPKIDSGASDGPVTDWNNAHYHRYFRNVKNLGTVVTAGANMGLHVRPYANMFENVYAFEPHWLNFYCFSYNCPYPNVFKMQAALGATCGQVDISEEPKVNMGAYTVTATQTKHSKVPMLTVDSLNLPKVDMIQLDVEGYEKNVLEGSIETLKRDKPVVVTERNRGGSEELLTNLGYVLQEKSISDYIYHHPDA